MSVLRVLLLLLAVPLLALAACSDSSGSGSAPDGAGNGGTDVREVPDTGAPNDLRERDLPTPDLPEDTGREDADLDATSGEDDTGGGDDANADPGTDPDGTEDVVDPGFVCELPPSGFVLEELCGDGQDNNNNGSADEGCPCSLGSTQPCYLGDPVTRNVGQCLDGIQICTGTPLTWGECQGGFLPSSEVCDDKDNDCDGCNDDSLIDCIPVFACPVELTTIPLSTYTLDGPSLLEVDETIISWRWTVVPPRNSATPGPVNPNAPVTELFVDVSGDYVVSLEAVDEKGALYGCSFILHAQGDGLRVELTWDTTGSVDLDLHLHRSGTTTDWCTDDDCFYANCNVSGGYDLPSWGYANSPVDLCMTSLSSCPNPRLDIDNIFTSDVPENINIDNPNHGDTFRVMVHYFGGSLTTRARVTIYCGGNIRAVLGEPPREVVLTDSGGFNCQGDTWRVADIRMVEDAETGVQDCLINVLTDGEGDWDIRNDDNSY